MFCLGGCCVGRSEIAAGPRSLSPKSCFTYYVELSNYVTSRQHRQFVAGGYSNYGPIPGYHLLIELLYTFCKWAVDTCHLQRIADRHLSLAGGVLHRWRGVPHSCCQWQHDEEIAPSVGDGHPNRVKGKDEIPCGAKNKRGKKSRKTKITKTKIKKVRTRY
jgi:hypothetical protein